MDDDYTYEDHCLNGKTITAIDLASDQKAMRFHIADGSTIIARADGGCCSNSWIEHVEQPAMGFPASVLMVQDLELPGSTRDEEDGDCLQVYGLKIVTDRGDITIDYRNESNGYYGGNLSWPESYFYGGVFGQNKSTDEWQPLGS